MPRPDRPTAFDDLRRAHPWPAGAAFPDVEPVGREPRGFALVERALDDLPVDDPVVLEIGAELGGSTRRLLSRPGVRVVSLDPWPDGKRFADFPSLRPLAGRPDVTLDLFRRITWEHRDRLVALRGTSPAGVVEVYDAGVRVDLVYVDGDHRADAVTADLEICAALFPDAVLTGDDWRFDPVGRRGYEGVRLPVQTAVRRWAQRYDVAVTAERNTWRFDRSRGYDGAAVPPFVTPTSPTPSSPTLSSPPSTPPRTPDAGKPTARPTILAVVGGRTPATMTP